MGELASQIQTARLWSRQLERDRTLLATVRVAFRETDEDTSKAVAGFAALSPPEGTDALRDRVLQQGDRAQTVLAELRIALDRGRSQEVVDRRDELRDVGEDLASLRAGLRR